MSDALRNPEKKIERDSNINLLKQLKWLKLGLFLSYILIVILFILLFLFKCNCPMNDVKKDIEKGTIDMIDPLADRDLQQEVNKAVEDGMFNVFMNTQVVFEDGKSKGNLLIQNVETNNASVFVEIYLKDTDDLIYKSYEIPAGYKIEESKLNKELNKGKYPCIAYFNILNDKKEVINKIGLNVDIIIEK